MNVIIGMLLLLCPGITMSQQLRIGDQLPPAAMQVLQKASAVAATTSHKKNPTIEQSNHPGPEMYLLDFWASWCFACRKQFPHVAEMQKQYGNKIKVVMVNSEFTGDDALKVNGVFKKFYADNPGAPALSQLIKDKLFFGFFPFSVLPSYVWINGKGTVLAVTGPEEFTAQNIGKVLKGETLAVADLSQVKQISAGSSVFFTGNNKDSLAAIHAGRADNLQYDIASGIVFDRQSHYQSRLAVAEPLITLYQRYSKLKPNMFRILLPQDHPLLQAKVNAELYLPDTCSEEEFNKTWVELLNSTFSLHGRFQVIDTLCYVLTIKDPSLFSQQQQHAASISSAGKDSILFKNKTPLFITGTMNSSAKNKSYWPVIIADSSFTQPISLALPNHTLHNDPIALQNALLPWGMQLQHVIRPIRFFVLSSSDPIYHQPKLSK